MSLTPSTFTQRPSGLLVPESTGAAEVSGNYTAAQQSTTRSYVYFPELRPQHDLPAADRKKIIEKARWCATNIGLGTRIVDGIAEMVGALTPQPATTDAEWNQEILALFRDLAGSPLIFDRAGEENFWDRQLTLTKQLVVDGDCLLALTSTSTGNPATQLYLSPQIGTPIGKTYRDGWFDGVLLDASNRRIRYNLKDNDLWKDGLQLSAQDALYFGDPKAQAPRSASKFAPIVDRMLDVRELDNDEMMGIKVSNLVGFYIANATAESIQRLPLSEKFTTGRKFGAVQSAGGTGDPTQDLQWESITQPGGTLTTLQPGQEIKAVHDARRHENRQAFIDYFIRDMAWGTGFPPEVIWFLGQLTGPGVRFMIKSGERAAKRYRRLLESRYCRRIWVWFVSKMIKSGRIRPCKDPRYWACEWLEPESLTIDLGRDTKSGLDEIERGGNTFQDWYAQVNADWKAAFRQKATEYAEAQALEKEFNLPPGTIIRQQAPALTIQQPNSAPAA